MPREKIVFLIIFAFFLVISFAVTITDYLERMIFEPTKDELWNFESEGGDSVFSDTKSIGRGKKFYGQHFSNINSDGPTGPTIVFFHGSSGNISYYKVIYDVAKALGYNLFMVEYDGYGKNDILKGSYWRGASEFVLEVYDHITSIIPKHNIILWGISLGGTTITYLSRWIKHDHPIIIGSSFSSIGDVIEHTNYKFLSTYERAFIGWIPSKLWAKYIRSPVLQYHSSEDKLVPIKVAKLLHDNIGSKDKTWVTIKGKHSSPDVSTENVEDIISFIWRFFPSTSGDLRSISEKVRDIINSSEYQFA